MSSNDQERLTPSHTKDRQGSSSSGSDADTSAGPSRSPSSVDFPPPAASRPLGFTLHANPFSPSASPSNSPRLDQTPTPRQGHHAQPSTSSVYTFPGTGIPSTADLTRMRNLGTRPTTSSPASPRHSSTRVRESFTSPPMRPLTVYSTAARPSSKIQRERPKSTMLSEEVPLEKSWLQQRDPHARMAYLLTYAMIFLGIAGGAVRCFFSWTNVQLLPDNKLCLVLNENFDAPDAVFGTNGTFFREVDMSGFGNGEFEMTTDSTNNSYVSNGKLYITPTLTSDVIGQAAVENGSVFNITGCTFNDTQGGSYTAITQNAHNFNAAAYYSACSAVSNSTTGAIINPIQSARLTTKKSASIKFGRVEVKAKIPRGDWLWPAIWMLPVDNKYGPWPMSGEIDIMESRGNGPDYPYQGNNVARGTLNWGPATWLNAGWKTFGWWSMKRTAYSDAFHTYALEWDEDFIRIYVDSRLHHMLDMKFNVPFWNRGNFPQVVQNGTETVILDNPWMNRTNAAPFDQSFYLILSLGVGGTNGWFPDGKNKPWLDGSKTAMSDFWGARNQWLPTWSTKNDDKSLVVDSVKMWQKCR